MSDQKLMSDERLEAIEARVNKATSGEWKTTGPEYEITIFSEQEGHKIEVVGASTYTGVTGFDYATVDMDKDDAEFIANARQDIPDLLGEVKRLRAENAELKRHDEWRESLRLVEVNQEWKCDNCGRPGSPDIKLEFDGETYCHVAKSGCRVLELREQLATANERGDYWRKALAVAPVDYRDLRKFMGYDNLVEFVVQNIGPLPEKDSDLLEVLEQDQEGEK